MKMRNAEKNGKQVKEDDEEGNQKRSKVVFIDMRYTITVMVARKSCKWCIQH